MAESSECKRNGSFAVMGTEQSDRCGRCSSGCDAFQCSDGCEYGKSQEPPMPGAPIACSLLSEERRASEERMWNRRADSHFTLTRGLACTIQKNTIHYSVDTPPTRPVLTVSHIKDTSSVVLVVSLLELHGQCFGE